ncbi:AVAST type 3 anti-phage nuclease/ATPase Avs3a [Saccharospirillum mangrovi]|uniref:AVAST type 3 anti-phage nuclease/ATPase Avs3a n=1 Tax=Saccharospirillum mangrovi TaxID=2161747 RepID=UPI000D33984F|nr:AVAST type 3 anti-phage nuclease/ATPase Avs3a [Saccharospirillum mangrovi]
MSDTDLVRASRDGDQFHYLWAARRCLLLLSPNTTLKAITIEGASSSETGTSKPVTAGEELIDVGEYYGSATLEKATCIRYVQVKHSTLRIDKNWPPSELEKTLSRFAERYKAIQERFPNENLENKLEFWFVSNRQINSSFLESIWEAGNERKIQNQTNQSKLEKFTGLSGASLKSFCKLLHLDESHSGLWNAWNLLNHDLKNYLPDIDVDAPILLKELVTKKALSSSAENPEITKMDVLRVLKTDEDYLFPAPCLIKDTDHMVPREQEPEIHKRIVDSDIPIIIHADGGVGKSILATRIRSALPTGSLSVLYDCFGDGQYRSASGYRHRHKDALVQISNELASQGICHPLIPSRHAEPSAYVKAFIYRLRQSINSLRSQKPDALLCIVIDAADNAQMAAEEIGENRSFVKDLIREQVPEGVRFVFLCRTHRQEYLAPPTDVLRINLSPFSLAETTAHLIQAFPEATEQDVHEFHRLSSHNPRVQALALSQNNSLSETLRALGPNPTTVEDTIGNLLEKSISKLQDAAGSVEKTQIDKICAGIAALRPLIPISVLASMSGVSEPAIKSFALDLGRPLLISGNTIQFFDEPAETWFREKFKPNDSALADFVSGLKPLASSSAYVASSLPQLLLEAGQFTELVELALSSDGLPTDSPIEKRDVELQRLHYALKASLRNKRYPDAAKLALKAGGESAGDERQRRLIQANTDLAAEFLDSDRIQELVSRRTFGSGWVGSHHAYEAGLLSGHSELLGDAGSRLRMAHEWLENWSRLPEEGRQNEEITDSDILEIATAQLNIYGAQSCADELRRWQPRSISFRIGRMLAIRLIDHGRFSELDNLAIAAGNNFCLSLAIIQELRDVYRNPPKGIVEKALRLVTSRHVTLKDNDHWHNEDASLIEMITTLVESSYRLSVSDRNVLIALLSRYLPASPPRSLASRHGILRLPLLRAYTLRAALSGQKLDVIELAHDELRKELEAAKTYSESQEARDFKESVGALLPWIQLWADALVHPISLADFPGRFDDAKSAAESVKHHSYREDSDTSNYIARIWLDILLSTDRADSRLIDPFDQWIRGLNRPLPTTTLTNISRKLAHSVAPAKYSLEYANQSFKRCLEEREDAESKSDGFIKLARAILTKSHSEAAYYFNQAVEVASKVGDENLDRWEALLNLSERAAVQEKPEPHSAFRLARCAELTYDYVVRDKYFDWIATVEAITGLCGSSSIAILSRWRDRNFGWFEETLPIAINFLVSRGDLNPKLALTLTAIRARWDKPKLLQHALEADITKTEKQVVSDFIYRYMALEEQSAMTWKTFKSILGTHNIAIPEISERINFLELKEETEKNHYIPSNQFTKSRKSERDWGQLFSSIDLSSSNDIACAYRYFRNSEPPHYIEHFFEEACRRVIAGKEAEFISAVAEVGDFDLYHLRYLLECLPESWKYRVSVKPALAKIIKCFCRRFCMEITKSRHYERLPLRIACEQSDLSEKDILTEVLTAIGEASDIANASRLFTLVGLLTPMMTKEHALEVLSFGLDLLDPVLEVSDGDGPWSSNFSPPLDIESSLAGCVWGCLAAPRASLRWEAAHVVRAFYTFNLHKIVNHLVVFASGASVSAFHDARLHFYDMHARLWLLIGLSRAAKDYPVVLVDHTDFLTQLAFNSEPHVLVREFAKRILLAILDAGLIDPKNNLRSRLMSINTSPFPPLGSKSNSHINYAPPETDDDDEDSFYFGIDIGPYWLEPLGRCFGKSQSLIEREVLSVIRDDWNLTTSSRWDADERHKKQIYQDRETHHSHGSYPRADELRFYLSYHAMMVAAGKILSRYPVHNVVDECEDDFCEWLSRHDLSRSDYGWLADRRDPHPLERVAWKEDIESEDWRWQLTRSDFDKLLIPQDNTINLWGHWNRMSGRRNESININSALVSSNRSTALLSALQSVVNPHHYRIPDACDSQIDFNGFQLKGWVIDQPQSSKLDEFDPWAGAVSYPPPAPAEFVIQCMKLKSDTENRHWFVENEDTCSLCSHTWGNFRDRDNDDSNLESGTRLQSSLQFVFNLLHRLEMDLIVKVEIERRRRSSHWENNYDDETRFTPASARLFLIKKDGSIKTL